MKTIILGEARSGRTGSWSRITWSTRALLIPVILLLAVPSVPRAQSKCDGLKLKAYGKKVLCLAAVDAKAQTTGEMPDAEKQQKCFDKFDKLCTKALDKGDCTSAVKSCSQLMDEAESCRLDARDAGDAVCCGRSNGGFGLSCSYTVTADSCVSQGGVPGEPWTVCNASPVGCVDSITSTGCCDFGGSSCMASDSGLCTIAFGTWLPSAVCTPTGCVAP